jgi:hypothetical protein
LSCESEGRYVPSGISVQAEWCIRVGVYRPMESNNCRRISICKELQIDRMTARSEIGVCDLPSILAVGTGCARVSYCMHSIGLFSQARMVRKAGSVSSDGVHQLQ